MAFILTVYIIDAGDGTIKVGHNFYGVTEKECNTYYREHLSSCEYFRAAEQDGRIIEEIEEVDPSDLPDADDWEEEEDDELEGV